MQVSHSSYCHVRESHSLVLARVSSFQTANRTVFTINGPIVDIYFGQRTCGQPIIFILWQEHARGKII